MGHYIASPSEKIRPRIDKLKPEAKLGINIDSLNHTHKTKFDQPSSFQLPSLVIVDEFLQALFDKAVLRLPTGLYLSIRHFPFYQVKDFHHLFPFEVFRVSSPLPTFPYCVLMHGLWGLHVA